MLAGTTGEDRMEIDNDVLGQMVAEVDELHHEGMRSMGEQIAELHFGEGRRLRREREGEPASRDADRASRRRFLRGAATVGLSGIVVSLGAAVLPIEHLLPGAGAADAPAPPPLDDPSIAAFAESLELAAVAAYQKAASGGVLKTPAVLAAATTFASHHQEHAAAFAGAAGSKATHKPNPKVLQLVGDQLTAARTENAVINAAFGLENTAASTYLFALGALQGRAALQLTASILPVESQHATVLGTALGKPLSDAIFMPSFITEQQKVDPTKFPAAT